MSAKKKKKKEIKTSKVAKKQVPLTLEKGFWKKNYLPGILLFLLAFVLYFQTIQYDYVLDDQLFITDNIFTQKGLAGISDHLTKESLMGYPDASNKDLLVGARYRPLSLVMFSIEYHFFGLKPSVGHFMNILLYGLGGLLLFRVLSMLFPPSKDRKWYMGIAFLASLFYIIHPIHTEVVANIKGRDEILSLLGVLGTLYCALRFVSSQKYTWLGAMALVFFLSLLAKEVAITWLAVIPLTLYCFTKANFKQIGKVLVPLGIVLVLYLIIRYQIVGYLLSPGVEITDIMNNPFADANESERYGTVFYTLLVYLKLLIFPHPLTHDYYPYHIPLMSITSPGALLGFLVYAILGIWALVKIKSKSIPAYGILFFITTLSIASNLVFTVGTFMNERFIFIPSLGFCVVLAWFIAKKLPDLMDTKVFSYALLALFCLGFGYKVFDRIPAWRNSYSLNVAAIEVSTESARANCFYATALFNEYKASDDYEYKKELITEASYYINKSLEIHPTYAAGLLMYSGIIAEEYRYDGDQAKLLKGFDYILRNRTDIPFVDEYLQYLNTKGSADTQALIEFYNNIGYGFFAQKGDLVNARKYLNYALQVYPNSEITLQNLQKIGN